MTKRDLPRCIIEALKANGGSATIVEICRYVWKNQIRHLPTSNDLFYTWGYDIRWAGQYLRDHNYSYIPTRGIWTLTQDGENVNPKLI